MIGRAQLLLLSSPLARLHPLARRAWQLSRFELGRPVTHADDFAGFAEFPDRDGLLLDVGASSGTSAMSFRVFNDRSPILSVEANPILEPELRFLKRRIRRFDYLITAAGDAHGSVTLHVPFYRGVPLTAYSSLLREPLTSEGSGLRDWLGDRVSSPHFHVEERVSPLMPLDDLALDPDFVKVDVEGGELAVVRGLTATLERRHPILLVERSGDIDAVERLVADLGYRPYAYRRGERRFVPGAGDGANVFFLPAGSRPSSSGHGTHR
jgi:FkbM family methyltransferase